MKPSDFKVGQVVWLPCLKGVKPHAVTKIGRKWVELGQHGRFDPHTMRKEENFIGYCERVYLAEQDFVDEQAKMQAWQEVRAQFKQYQPPAWISMAELEVIKSIMIPRGADSEGTQ